MNRIWILISLSSVCTACSAPSWPEGSELVVRERSVDVIGLIWDDAEGASSYVAELDGQTLEILSPNVEARFDGLEESRLYLIEVRAQNAFGESEPLRIQVRTRDGTPPVFPEGAQLSYELATGARFSWPAASDAVGVTGYTLRGIDDQEVLETLRETEVIYADVPPQRVEVVAADASRNESEPLVVEISDAELAAYAQRRMDAHREIAEGFAADQLTELLGNPPPGINPMLVKQLVMERVAGR